MWKSLTEYNSAIMNMVLFHRLFPSGTPHANQPIKPNNAFKSFVQKNNCIDPNFDKPEEAQSTGQLEQMSLTEIHSVLKENAKETKEYFDFESNF